MIAIINELNNQQTVIHLHGSMDRKGIKHFNLNYNLPESDMILNFRHVTNLDSAGIGFLIKLFKYAYSKGFRIQLADVPVKIRMLLEITQVDQIFEIIDNHNNHIAIAA